MASLKILKLLRESICVWCSKYPGLYYSQQFVYHIVENFGGEWIQLIEVQVAKILPFKF